jgi:hypothetical protein
MQLPRQPETFQGSKSQEYIMAENKQQIAESLFISCEEL